MNILVVSRVSIPAKDRTLPAWEHLRRLGHTVTVEHPRSLHIKDEPDAIISMGVTVMQETFEALKRFPKVPLYCYNWDVYEWVWSRPRKGEYDYVRYGHLLEQAREVWVPSECTGKRTEQWYGLKFWHTILSSVPYWDYADVQDKGYVYCALREIPDPKWDMLERACKGLNIPLVMTKHERSYEDYQRILAHCSFLVSHCFELSTGGLSLLEGYYLGKPCLLSSSDYHGGKDYLGNRAQYFQWDDYEHFKHMLQVLWNGRRELREPLNDGADWVRKEFSDEVMVEKMLRRMQL